MSLDPQKHMTTQVGSPTPCKSSRLCLSLVDLTPKTYVDTIARVVSLKAREKEDDLGKRPYLVGIMEDSSFRIPFISYKPYNLFFRDSVFKFQNAYVHNFTDHTTILVLNEHSRIDLLPEENPENYVWQPKIGRINRPLGNCWVTLQGVVSSVYPSSGLVQRCERCNRVIFESSCPDGHKDGWRWSLRISGRLSDETGSINTIFSQHLTSRLLERPISEIMYLANVPELSGLEDFKSELFQLEVPSTLQIYEATVIEPSNFRQCRKLIVPDFNSSKIYCPKDVKVTSSQILEVKEKTLNFADESDRLLYRKIVAKAVDLKIREQTGLPKLHGVFLAEDPVSLYSTEQAKLFLGLELNVSADASSITLEFYPRAMIRESVLDYVNWQRARGASSKSIENRLLKWRRNVLLAPNGTCGRLVKILYEDAANYDMPNLNLSLPEFWRTTHDIEVRKEERPLLVVKPYNLDVELTYPPSCVFFDEQSMYVRSSVWVFVNYKKSALRRKVHGIAENVLKGLEIGGMPIKTCGEVKNKVDAQKMFLQDIREKLLGKTVKASGKIVQANETLYFFPKTVSGVSF